MASNPSGQNPPTYSPPVTVQRDITRVTMETFMDSHDHKPVHKKSCVILRDLIPIELTLQDIDLLQSQPELVIMSLSFDKWRDFVFAGGEDVCERLSGRPPHYLEDLDINVHLSTDEIMQMEPSSDGFRIAVIMWLANNPYGRVMRITLAVNPPPYQESYQVPAVIPSVMEPINMAQPTFRNIVSLASSYPGPRANPPLMETINRAQQMFRNAMNEASSNPGHAVNPPVMETINRLRQMFRNALNEQNDLGPRRF
ncbi:uncharacterized protein TRUGW13939_06231 [Talaromyces rugulosus]|uniref:Uncharacterized protein n=1 Tax=Talaromyces rugulosus TaxID=121627 RepID=A0A7H8QYB0_TALRU|nr:uncharacterized protein TRUGW13939_06231 [Talaromyces rugulosus]QKX59100.1 hypothetical protein TRUGW13939_06231 [Talaromyces rugulosus]